ncbi:MAG TPA: HNH endonuclease signature motif containing protein [Acidimicrobiales bacterium]|nr:HNH endonuclease signature motif containing protein [Acidimicrobiales bacterium]
MNRTADKVRQWRQRSKPLARGSWMDRRGRIKKMSAKQQQRAAAVNAIRPLIAERSGGLCEARLPGCKLVAHHLHHRKQRSVGGQDTYENLLHLCWHCHQMIHDDETVSYARGFVVHGWDDPAEVTIQFAAPAPPTPPGVEADVRAADGGGYGSLRPPALPTNDRVQCAPMQSDRPHSAAAESLVGPVGGESVNEKGRDVA